MRKRPSIIYTRPEIFVDTLAGFDSLLDRSMELADILHKPERHREKDIQRSNIQSEKLGKPKREHRHHKWRSGQRTGQRART